ncbi:MAG: hypothetical protein HQM13_02635 [SAR324 cluster bacterium]|nr:hypothetical protein [SAR324 cluster bacterium]
MSDIKIGILGMGFLGKHLIQQYPKLISWGTFRTAPPQEALQNNINSIEFEWNVHSTWNRIPDEPVVPVLTMPPVFQDPEKEVKRLSEWSVWMNKERPQLTRLIYISSTGVYPNSNRIWKEEDFFVPDRPGGQLRLDTERTLENYFDLSVIRAGGIYGPQRHLGLRILDQKPFSQSERPIHRIYVKDLARIVRRFLEEEYFPSRLNAVDEEPKPSYQIVEWLLQNELIRLPPGISNPKQTGSSLEKDCLAKNRLISNQKLLHEMQFSLQFPSFREGFADIFGIQQS